MSRQIFDHKFVWFLSGVLWGAVLVFIGGVLYLRSSLIQTAVLPVPYDAFVENLPKSGMNGWRVQREKCLVPNAADGTPVAVFKFCKKDYAELLLADDLKYASLLPCSAAFVRTPDGKVRTYRMNTILLGYLLGKTPAALFTQKIKPEQQQLLLKAATGK